jgi:hypothetical protein
MHYKNGREAKNNDPVVYPNGIVGTLHDINPNCTSCNGQVATVVPGGVTQHFVNLGDGYHAQDALDAVEATTATAKANAPAAANAAEVPPVKQEMS